jgi:hypothetical protein
VLALRSVVALASSEMPPLASGSSEELDADVQCR